MKKHPLPHLRWAWLTNMIWATGLVLSLSRCEQNPIIEDHTGSQWTLQDTVIFAMSDSSFTRTTSHGGSLTLYAGFTDEPIPREAGILIKFASVDSSRLANFLSARLVLFRRTFGVDTLPDPSAAFNLFTIDSQDTIWSESDTAGHTELDLLESPLESTASMSTDSITIPSGDTTVIRTDLEYLEFPVNSTILSAWRTEETANNGFLIKLASGDEMFGFHSHDADLSPYVALDLLDTTAAGGSTTITLAPTGDLSVYPWPNPNFDPIDSDGLLHLDRSSGVRSHLDFGPYFDPDTTSIIAGARLVLHVNQDSYPLTAEQVDLVVLRRELPLAEEDSTLALFNMTYTKEDDSLVLNLGSFVTYLAAEAVENHGLDLWIIPYNYDFDHLVFWGPDAGEILRPRLEIIYGRLYQEAP